MFSQAGLFDLDDRLAQLSKAADPLERLQKAIPWQALGAKINDTLKRGETHRSPQGGRPSFDGALLFKMLVIQALYNLSDDQLEYQCRDRLSFMRFLGLKLHHRIPDAKTVWAFRESLKQAELDKELFDAFKKHLKASGYIAMSGQMVDASIVEAPRQRNTREENEAIKAGETPKDWQESPAKNAQKDKDARWTKKNEQTYFGYKNHVMVDVKHKMIWGFRVTDAAVHDSQVFKDLVDKGNTSRGVWADSAYRSQEAEAFLKEHGFQSRVHEKAYRNRPLNGRQKRSNKAKSRVRARVEHVFGAMNRFEVPFIQTIGLARARVKLTLANLVYNFGRFAFLEARKTRAHYA